MKIGAALAADLDILTAALDEPGADVLHTLHQLGVDAQAAVPTYLGLSVTVDSSDPPFTFTTVEDGMAADVRTSLRLRLAGVSDGRASPSVALTLYAGTPGTFVDLTADLAWLTGRAPSDFALDQHLSVPAGSDAETYLRAASVINQAIGVLIGRGCTPEQAHRELDTQADSAGTDRHTTAQFILDTLAAEDPADAEHTDQEPDIG
jgi:ANTAR domain